MWTTPTYASGNFFGPGGMPWTVESGDVTTFEYMIIGKTMWMSFHLINTTISGTADYNIYIAIPASKTAAKTITFTYMVYQGNWVMACGNTAPSGSTINLFPDVTQAAKWALSTNATFLVGNIFFEIN